MRAAELNSIPLYPELRSCPAPSAPRVLEIFNGVARHHLISGDQIVQVGAPCRSTGSPIAPHGPTCRTKVVSASPRAGREHELCRPGRHQGRAGPPRSPRLDVVTRLRASTAVPARSGPARRVLARVRGGPSRCDPDGTDPPRRARSRRCCCCWANNNIRSRRPQSARFGGDPLTRTADAGCRSHRGVCRVLRLPGRAASTRDVVWPGGPPPARARHTGVARRSPRASDPNERRTASSHGQRFYR